MHRVDYDRIAHLYDEPQREHAASPDIVAFFARPDRALGRRRLLDIGCGTGTHLAAHAVAVPEVQMVGLDRFGGMLRVARRRGPRVQWTQGDGARLPFAARAFDYVTSQFSYPHVGNVGGLVAEAFRVLRPGGRFEMINIDPWAMPDWAIYRYFPEAMELDRQDFVPVDAFTAAMRACGFTAIVASRQSRPATETAAAFLAFALERHRASQLMAISDRAYVAGIDRLRAEAERETRPFVSDFVLVAVTGDRET